MSMNTQLKNTMDTLAQQIVTDVELESVFLATLGNMEEVAAREITKTIDQNTPPDAVLEVVAHARDEHRHAFQLRALRPVKKYSALKYYHLENDLSEIGINFVLGFFGQQLLLKSRNASRFSGYVHGALTIEQVPLQLYTAYYKLMKIESVRKGMAEILKDEAGHLALGQKFYDQLSPEQKFSIDEINQIEIEMCEVLGRKMLAAILKMKKQNDSETAEASFEDSICANRAKLADWILALAENETRLLNPGMAQLLSDSILFVTGQSKNNSLKDLSANLETIKKWNSAQLLNHYKKLSEATKLLGVSYALEKVMQLKKISSDLTLESSL